MKKWAIILILGMLLSLLNLEVYAHKNITEENNSGFDA